MGKLSDWHQLGFTSADSSVNGHRLNPSRLSIPQGALGAGGSRQTAAPISNEFGTRRQIRLGTNIG